VFNNYANIWILFLKTSNVILPQYQLRDMIMIHDIVTYPSDEMNQVLKIISIYLYYN